jgi:hypothetical protein
MGLTEKDTQGLVRINYLPNVLVSAAALCTTKCVLGVIVGAATLDVTSEVGIATGIATRPRRREDFEAMINF